MDSSHQSLLPSSSRETMAYEYDVFLSFRGPDTRPNFTDCLYTTLTDARISVFRDNDELNVGKNISTELREKIWRSRISIPIFSKTYAFSKSCLMEVAEMAECMRQTGHVILPIFYDIAPSVVKHQTDTFKSGFSDHEKNGTDPKTISKWKRGLREIASLKGWEVSKIHDGHYSKVIPSVLALVIKLLEKAHLVIPDNLVGIDDHALRVMRKLDISSTGVSMVVVIHGIPGIGKTTLAKFVYNQICDSYERCCFLENIQEAFKQNDGIRCLQRQLASDLLKQRRKKFHTYDEGTQFIKSRFVNTKVLILLDGVDESEQLKKLVGDGNWFGQGSRIIVTTNRSDVIDIPVNTLKYQVEPMKDPQALELFYWHAFGSNTPKEGFHTLSTDIASLIGGIPLALEVIASGLFDKPIEIWKDTCDKLREKPDATVMDKLKISYEYLDDWQKKIFLDIACFLIGKDKRFAFHMWEACNLYPSSGIASLLLLSLVKIGGNGELWMHDLMRDLGREIVRMENPDKPGKRSRLWNHTDAFQTLKRRMGTRKVEGLSLTFEEGLMDKRLFDTEFIGLSNLRFLKLDQATIRGYFKHHLSNLKWLDWEGCRKIRDVLDMHLEKLVVLDLSSSKISEDRYNWNKLMEMAKELKVLNLNGCANLHGSPCFPAQMALKILILESCQKLMQVHPSISNLRDLESLNLKFCREVKQLPDGLIFLKELKELLIDGTSVRRLHFPNGSMEKLEILTARGCKNLTEVSDLIGNLKSLTHLALDDAVIKKLPRSIGSLERLRCLSLRNCQNLLQLPESVGYLKSLTEIDLSNTKIARLPHSFKNLENLKVLKMEGCFVKEFPQVLSYLSKMEEIDFSLCRSLSGDISVEIISLPDLRILRLRHTDVSSLGSTILELSNLEVLDLRGCKKLLTLPILPSSLSCLQVGSESLYKFPDLSTLIHLKELYLQFDPVKATIEVNGFRWILSLSKLEILELHLLKQVELSLPPEFTDLSQLRKVMFSGMDLRRIQFFPSKLSTLSLEHCILWQAAPDFSKLTGLYELELIDCQMERIHGLEKLQALQILKLSDCTLRSLWELNQLANLRTLNLLSCKFHESLPDTSCLKLLSEKEIDDCRYVHDVENPRHKGSNQIIEDQFLNSQHDPLYAEDRRNHSFYRMEREEHLASGSGSNYHLNLS